MGDLLSLAEILRKQLLDAVLAFEVSEKADKNPSSLTKMGRSSTRLFLGRPDIHWEDVDNALGDFAQVLAYPQNDPETIVYYWEIFCSALDKKPDGSTAQTKNSVGSRDWVYRWRANTQKLINECLEKVNTKLDSELITEFSKLTIRAAYLDRLAETRKLNDSPLDKSLNSSGYVTTQELERKDKIAALTLICSRYQKQCEDFDDQEWVDQATVKLGTDDIGKSEKSTAKIQQLTDECKQARIWHLYCHEKRTRLQHYLLKQENWETLEHKTILLPIDEQFKAALLSYQRNCDFASILKAEQMFVVERYTNIKQKPVSDSDFELFNTYFVKFNFERAQYEATQQIRSTYETSNILLAKIKKPKEDKSLKETTKTTSAEDNTDTNPDTIIEPKEVKILLKETNKTRNTDVNPNSIFETIHTLDEDKEFKTMPIDKTFEPSGTKKARTVDDMMHPNDNYWTIVQATMKSAQIQIQKDLLNLEEFLNDKVNQELPEQSPTRTPSN